MHHPIEHVVPEPGQLDLLTAKEVAVLLRCHVSTVYQMKDAGRLQGFCLMGRSEKKRRGKNGLRILASSVRELITSGIEENGKPLPSEEAAVPVVGDKPMQMDRPEQPRQKSAGQRGRSKSRVFLAYPPKTR